MLGGESGDIHVWEAETLHELSRHKAHSGPWHVVHNQSLTQLDGSFL